MSAQSSDSGRKLRVATRGSALALAQTRLVCEWIASTHQGIEVEVVTVRTTGDIRCDEPISSMAGRGVFVDAVEQSLLSGETDFAVHSAKDLPALDGQGLRIAAYPKREDARDVLISRDGRTVRSLPPSAKVGTSSQRRACQLHAMRPDLEIVELRGNVDTRVRKVDEGFYDAIILAAAGLNRLSLSNRISEWLSLDDFLPAPAQGALAVQVRRDDPNLLKFFDGLNDSVTSLEVTAERSFLARLGIGCASPVAAHAVASGDSLTLRGFLKSNTGEALRHRITGPVSLAAQIGEELADHLKELDSAQSAQ